MAKYNKEKRQQVLNAATLEQVEYTDSHFHTLALQEKDVDIKQLLTTLLDKKFIALDIAISENDIEERYNLLKAYNNIYLCTGVGPWGTKTETDHDNIIKVLEKNIKNYPIKAIGEIGLDNHWDYGTKELQTDLFLKQINLANQYNLPISIHNREADNQILEIIKKTALNKNSIIHCFSSDLEFAKIALDKGFYISFAGPITYKQNDSLRDILKYIPLDRLLLETDSPYLPPEPFRGKINSPILIPLIYKRAAEIKKVTIEEICLNVKRNLLTLLDCPLT